MIERHGSLGAQKVKPYATETIAEELLQIYKNI